MTLALRDRLASFFAADAHGALAAYVFGSAARGDERAGSDVDVAVLFEQPPPPTLSGPALSLETALERHLARAVDLIVLNSASADLVHRVLRDGVIVLDRVPSRRLQFEVHKRNEFFDLEPLRRRYRRAVGLVTP